MGSHGCAGLKLATLIRGGSLADGTGAPLLRRDLLIEGGRIARILPPSSGALRDVTVIDADGLVVCPGFIDLHSHADFSVEDQPAATGLLAQGVTSVVTGNCGWSPFPLPAGAAARELLRDWSAFLGEGPSWAWNDLEGFASRVGAAAPGVHVLPLVGHIPVRLAELGGEQRGPSALELLRMREHVLRAMTQGAWGLSTGLIYAPGSFADAAEIEALVQAAASLGGLYATHIRDETAQLLDAIDEAISAANAARRTGAGARLQISHIKAMGPANHGRVRDALARIDEAHASGLDVAADVYPYTASGTTLASRLPAWALDGGADELCARLAHESTRARISDALTQRFERGDFDPSGIVLSGLGAGRFAGARGSSLSELARELGETSAEAALSVLAAHRGVVGIINHAMAEEDVCAALAHPLVAVASDGGALEPTRVGSTHPRAFGTFARLFARYVRELGVLSLEEAVRKVTGLPASRLGITDRGVIREGAVADVTVFDPVGIRDLADYEDPWRLAVGVHAVLLGGRAAVLDGRITGLRGGRVLRRARALEAVRRSARP